LPATSACEADPSRAAALKRGVRLEIVTVSWMVVEAAVAIGSGIAALSVLLIAFGLDSVIELLSAGVLLWRLRVEVRDGDTERVEKIERRAERISAALLLLLCLFLVVTIVLGLLNHVEPETSPMGIFVAIAAVVLMPMLARRKQRVNMTLQSPALRADIAESVTCAYMAGTVLLGLLLNSLLGWWWFEYVAAVALLYWLVSETREAWEAVREQ